MTHWVKFGRAHDHFAKIDRVISHFLDMQPHHLVSECRPRGPYQVNAAFTFTLRAYAPATMPAELPTLVGDCLNNLRASLDHLIYQIAVKHTGVPVNNKRLSFAICEDSVKFGSFKGTVANDLPPDVLTLMEGRQPYQGMTPDIQPERHLFKHPLWILHELVNADKHRAVMPVTQIRVTDVRFIPVRSRSDMLPGLTVSGAFEHGAEVVSLPMFANAPSARVDVKSDFAAEVAFSDEWPAYGRPVRTTLQGIRDYIRNEIFPEFEPYL